MNCLYFCTLRSWNSKLYSPVCQLDFRTPPGFDRTRNAEIGNKDIKFKHLEEAFTSEHWLVRIYKVKNLDNREPLDHKLRSIVPKQKYTSKKVTRNQLCFCWKGVEQFDESLYISVLWFILLPGLERVIIYLFILK